MAKMLHSSYHAITQTSLNGYANHRHHHPGLDLTQASHYTLQQLQQHQQHVGVLNPHLTRGSQFPKLRQLPYGRAASAAGLIRRRISRACDQCNQLRTKCNGEAPCLHCQQFGLQCEYVRERKKRGKASRKDLAAQAAAAQAATTSLGSGDQPSLASAGDTDPTAETASEVSSSNRTSASTREVQASKTKDNMLSMMGGETTCGSQRTASLDSLPELDTSQVLDLDSPGSVDLNGYGQLYPAYEHIGAHMMSGMSSYPDLPYSIGTTTGQSSSYLADSPLSTGPLSGDTTWGWMSMSPPPSAQFVLAESAPSDHDHSQLRYPVLEPLMPYLKNLMGASLACDLLDLYFSSPWSALMHPVSPYVLASVFRKKSFMHPTKPRQCKKALLASMLWVAAQTSDTPVLTSVPSGRDKMCQRLLELTVSLLKPLIHTSSGRVSPASFMASTDVSVGMDALLGQSRGSGAAGSLDDVVTYIHLATLTSASEFKSASLRWWSAAWSLARELKLGREVTPSLEPDSARDDLMGEEEKEERRRVWWLAYMVDRHLALCYNRPLFLLDAECSGLFQPMDETDFQNGLFTDPDVLASDSNMRARGPALECTGHGLFGFFLPLMTILGEMVDLHHARNHPRFGSCSGGSRELDSKQVDISCHLDRYEASLQATLERRASSLPAKAQDEQATDVQLRLVTAYARYIMCVLRMLKFGKWDYLELLDDNDGWISSPGFMAATQHAVDAAEAIAHVLEYDPALVHMPFFLGIYLLQGSFLLLFMAEKLQLEASASVLGACETMVRAHEASMATLSTAYQHDFTRIMRSALQEIRHGVSERYGEQHQRRRELLALYRWTGDGTGLAL